LDELLNRFLQTLLQVCQADAGHLYVLNDRRSAWVLRASASSNSRRPRPALLEVPNRPQCLKLLSKPRQVDCTRTDGSSGYLLDPSWKGQFQSCWSIPLAAGGRTAGVMQFGFS